MEKDSLGKMIVHLGRMLKSRVDEKLEKHKLGNLQFRIVILANKNRGLCQDRLSKMMRIDKTTTAKAIKKLIDLGYIKKERDELDKRFYRIFPTEKAENIYPKILDILRETDKSVENILTEKEKESLRIILEKLQNGLKEEL